MKTYLLISFFLISSIACFSQTSKVIGENGMTDEEYERITRLRNEIEEISQRRKAAENKLPAVSPMSGDCSDLDRVSIYINQLEQAVNAYEKTEARGLCKQEAAKYKELNGANYNESLNSCDRFDYKLNLAKENLQKYRDCLNGNKSQPSNSSKEIKIDLTNDGLQSKENQLNDAQNFIDNQNSATERYDTALENLGNTLNSQFTQISNVWAKETEFQSKISSLTNIKSVNVSSIISEARSKAQEINIEYSELKSDALNQGINATQTLINSAQNEKQAIAGAALGAIGTIASQASLEKSRKDAQAKLENQRIGALQNIAEKIRKKFRPLIDKYENALIYAVLEGEVKYYESELDYAKCMTDKAYEIVVNDYSCNESTLDKPGTNINYTGKNYYDAYKQKAQSTELSIKNKAPYFLELAIEAEPNNAEWLYEKTIIKEFSVRTKTSILFKAHNADVNNEKIKTAYESELKKLKEIEKIEQKYISRFLNSDRFKSFDWNKNDNLYIMHIKINAKIKSLALNRNGEIIFRLGDELMLSKQPLTYQYEMFNNGLLKVKMKNDNENYDYGFVNTKGKLVIPLKEYNDAGSFYNGFAKVQNLETKLYGFIDTYGNQIVEFNYSDAENFHEGLAPVQDKNPNDKINSKFWGFIDNKGNVIIPLKFLRVSRFSEGLAAVKELPKNIKSRFIDSEITSHYIDLKGNTVISRDFNYANPFSNGLAVVGDKRNYWFIDKDGNEVFNEKFDMANDFNENGYALVKKKKYYYFINKKGENETQNKFKGKPTFNVYEKKYNEVLNSKNNLVQIDENGNIIEK